MPRKDFQTRQNGASDIDINNTNVLNCCPLQGSMGGRLSNTGANDYTIERHLASFEHTPPYDLLWSNWVIEKETYKKRLSTIARSFPTYSSHDASHSEVILSRIEALLGEARLRLLLPTDAWLLLQCAYTHDLGMGISEKENDDLLTRLEKEPDIIKGLIERDDFKKYLMEMDRDVFFSLFRVHDPLITSVRFLLKVIDNDDKNEIERFIGQVKKSEYSKAKSMFSTITTQYFRSRHAERTRSILMREAQDCMLNGIIPERLRKFVAEIDYCHGALWNKILSCLPQQDNGLSTDYIHPQFVAALLRLGDLLDLDSNRFNRYQIEQVEPLPGESMVHYLKHMAITRMMVSPQRIDIEARYNTTDVERVMNIYYFSGDNGATATDAAGKESRQIMVREMIERSANALRDWIGWLHDDLKEFAQHWNAIIPEDMPGYIATLRKNDIYIDDKPVEPDELLLRYIISPQRAARIIEGAELYDDALTFIREVVQNSIDASKKQIFKNAVEFTAQMEQGQQDRLAYYPVLLDRYYVDIDMKYCVAPKSRGGAVDALEITFRDYGIGITYDKLKQMRHIGAIARSDEERREQREMEEWLNPTGEFGIGMQSVFTVADSFEIHTFPRYEANRSPGLKRNIRLSCPELGGDIVNEEETKEGKEKNRFGTDVVVRISLDRDNLSKLLRYKDASAFDRRTETVQNINAVMSKVVEYIQETFTDDLITLNFNFSTPEGSQSCRTFEPFQLFL